MEKFLLAVLQNEMNNITDAEIACAQCESAQCPPATTRNANDIQMVVVPNVASSNSKKTQMSEILTSGNCHSMSSHVCHTVQGLCHKPISQFSFFASTILDLQKNHLLTKLRDSRNQSLSWEGGIGRETWLQ